jgi:ABC-type glutathione transport system ATPase component
VSEIVLSGVSKTFPGGVKAVDGINLTIKDGEFMVLVGPSGCGKTTLLRMIAGLETVDEGSIRLGDRDITQLEPRDRDIAMVFQDYALYPHMNVRGNLSYGLRVRKTPTREIERRVDEVAALPGAALSWILFLIILAATWRSSRPASSGSFTVRTETRRAFAASGSSNRSSRENRSSATSKPPTR